jgi:hypothetical protein
MVKKIYIPYLSRPQELATPLTLFLNNQNSSLLKLSASNSFNYKPGPNNTWKAFGVILPLATLLARFFVAYGTLVSTHLLPAIPALVRLIVAGCTSDSPLLGITLIC